MLLAPDPLHVTPEHTILSNPIIGRDADGFPARVPKVVLFPTRGIALLDTSDAPVPNAAWRLAATLTAAGFERTYPGHLPILHRTIAKTDGGFDLTTLADDLDAAFALEAPMALRNDPQGLSWTRDVIRILSEGPQVPSPGANRGHGRLHLVKSPGASRRAKIVVQAGTAALIIGGAVMVAHQAGFSPFAPTSAPAPPLVAAPETSATANTPPPDEVAAPVVQEPPLPEPEPLLPSPPFQPMSEPQAPSPADPVAIASEPRVEALPRLPPPSAVAPKISNASLIERAQNLLSLHDTSSARLVLQRAYEQGDGTAAVMLGQTYERFDPAMAAQWYEKARGTGDPRVAPMLPWARGVGAATRLAVP